MANSLGASRLSPAPQPDAILAPIGHAARTGG
jgi:hypothetical protein